MDEEKGISITSSFSILLNSKLINSQSNPLNTIHSKQLPILSVPPNPTTTTKTTNSSKCSSPPSPSQPSLPSPQPQLSSAPQRISVQTSTLPSAVNSTSTVLPISLALRVSLDQSPSSSEKTIHSANTVATAESDLTTVADFEESCKSTGLTAMCCTLPVVCCRTIVAD